MWAQPAPSLAPQLPIVSAPDCGSERQMRECPALPPVTRARPLGGPQERPGVGAGAGRGGPGPGGGRGSGLSAALVLTLPAV